MLTKRERPVRSGDAVVTAFRDGQVTLRSARRDEGFTLSDQEIGYQGVEPGDLVIHGLDAFAGSVGVSDSRGKCSPVYHVCRATNDADARFVAYALRAEAASGYLALQAGNVRQRAVDFRNWQTLAHIVVPCPPPHIQRAIADFLDAETTRIDRIIAARQRQIALVRQRLAAAIVEAFRTKPLPFASVRRVFRLVNGSTPRSDVPKYWDGEIVWVTPQDLSGPEDVITKSARTITAEGYASCGTTLVPAGSILLSTRAPIGSVAIAGADLCTNQGCRALVAGAPVDPWFFFFVFLAAGQDLQNLGNGSTFSELGSADLASLSIPAPGIEDQRHIARHLRRVHSDTRQLLLSLSRHLDLLHEHRQAIVAAAVTGQIEIPRVAA
jgi:type I restriction enzyme S subunit